MQVIIIIDVVCNIQYSSVGSESKKTISGNITDENGVSVIGASVFVKGTTTGTVSDIDGNFSLAVPESSVITISYMGYHPQEISVAGKTNLSIVLKEDNQLLDELVVIGYGVMKKKRSHRRCIIGFGGDDEGQAGSQYRGGSASGTGCRCAGHLLR